MVVLFFWVIGREEELGLVGCFLFFFFFFLVCWGGEYTEEGIKGEEGGVEKGIGCCGWGSCCCC